MTRATRVTTAVKSSRATTSTALPIFNKSNGLVHSLLGGWQVAGTFVKETGEPGNAQSGNTIGAGFSGVTDPIGLGGNSTGNYQNRANVINKSHYHHKVS